MTSVLAEVGKIVEVRAAPRRIRFEHLDGIRGMTSLYVVLAHVGILIDRDGVWPWLKWVIDLTRGGHTAVSIFIVLSGYCLMMPVIRSRNSNSPSNLDSIGGFLPYIGRRARRILPPYYAILILCLLVMALVPGGPRPVGNWWSTMWPAFTKGVLISHFLLVHNLNEGWVYKIDAPMWSVATEWQIYFLFPLVLLPIFRKLGVAPLIVCSIAIGLAPLYFFRRFEWASPWFSALFAIGMASAVGFGRRDRRRGYLAIAASFAVIAAALTICEGRLSIRGSWKFQFVMDLVSGGAVGGFLAWAAERVMLETTLPARFRSPILLFLTSRIATWLGMFSYSLYLTHALVLVVLNLIISKLLLNPNARALGILGLGTFLSIGFAFLFYLAAEKPFLRQQGNRN
ncbi:MAG TPA: acyltransferase [Tepidisphaeraceae bacterium]|jgi:peptidoglycan/LPS O-acetylase OafA/YrhL|nr:acyltransferase [Tepidisphaeraceae bacterium]